MDIPIRKRERVCLSADAAYNPMGIDTLYIGMLPRLAIASGRRLTCIMRLGRMFPPERNMARRY